MLELRFLFGRNLFLSVALTIYTLSSQSASSDRTTFLSKKDSGTLKHIPYDQPKRIKALTENHMKKGLGHFLQNRTLNRRPYPLEDSAQKLIRKTNVTVQKNTKHLSEKIKTDPIPTRILDSSIEELNEMKKAAKLKRMNGGKSEKDKMKTEESNSHPNKRLKRSTTYEIELLMVTDPSILSYWKDRAPSGYSDAEKTSNAKHNIYMFFVSLFKALNLRFESLSVLGYEVKLLLVDILISEDPAIIDWTETTKDTSFTPPRVNANISLENFRDWLNATTAYLNDYDHAILFTAYDLEDEDNNTIEGLTYTGGMCDPLKPSIVEFGRDVTYATLAAMMLGHSLGAEIDGNGNACPPNGNYVMDPFPLLINDMDYNRRQWLFSSCSRMYIDAFITDLNDFGLNCMETRSPNFTSLVMDNYGDLIAGQLYTPDIQCAAVRGTGCYFCRETLDSDYTTICAAMACSQPDNSGTCIYTLPWDGTSCGDGKICEKGYCVASASAPTGHVENCIFGDQPQNLAGQIKSCGAYISTADDAKECYVYEEECCDTCSLMAEPYSDLTTDCRYGNQVDGCGDHGSICYTPAYVPFCCSLCQNAYIGVPDCEYGDYTPQCTHSSLCYVDENRPFCCSLCVEAETGVAGCEYGDQSDQCSHGSVCYVEQNHPICCSLCPNYNMTDIPGCEYGDWSAECIHSSQCYNDHNLDICCELCNTSYTGITDCMYGDKDIGCVDLLSPFCYDFDHLCCKTCLTYATGIPARSPKSADGMASGVEPGQTDQSDLGCEYGDFNTEECNHGGLCYLEANRPICCLLCDNAFINITDCEYGDRAEGCVYEDCTSYDAYTFETLCCGTCWGVPYTPPTTTTTVSTTFITTQVTTATSTVTTETTATSSSTAPTSTTTKTTTEPSKLNLLPIIIGAAAGGLLLLGLIAAALWFLVCRQAPGPKIVPDGHVLETDTNDTELKPRTVRPLISWKVTGTPSNFKFSPARLPTSASLSAESPPPPLPYVVPDLKAPPVAPVLQGPHITAPPMLKTDDAIPSIDTGTVNKLATLPPLAPQSTKPFPSVANPVKDMPELDTDLEAEIDKILSAESPVNLQSPMTPVPQLLHTLPRDMDPPNLLLPNQTEIVNTTHL